MLPVHGVNDSQVVNETGWRAAAIYIIMAQSQVQLSATGLEGQNMDMQGKMSLNLVIVMMGQVMDWQCEFFPVKCMQCEGIYRKPSHAIDNSQCEGERELCLSDNPVDGTICG